MGKKLYVGNLAYSVTSDDLGIFSPNTATSLTPLSLMTNFPVARKVSVLSNLTIRKMLPLLWKH
jgi:hypothetical protein